MRIAKIERNSVANGPGVRLVVWCQGCSIHCPGCHNQSTWDPCGGQELTQHDKIEMLNYLSNTYVDGVTFSGGHPLEDYNIDGVVDLIRTIESYYPSKTIWLYTGRVLEYKDFKRKDILGSCLCMCDVIVDGPYIEEQRNIGLPYCGSSNQRVIDVKKTLKNKKITLWKEQ